jgi:hypothetical protein
VKQILRNGKQDTMQQCVKQILRNSKQDTMQ